MKDLYYNIEDGEFISQSGEKLTRFVPELFYQENAVWRIFLRNRENRPCDISGIIAWSAAVDCDYDSETAPMCRVLPEDISADVAAGSVTVTLDAATAEFLAAVNGVAKCKAFFEMHGVNTTGDRKFYFGFEIAARMILDPSPGVPQQVPEIFATRLYADLAAANAASGAIVSGAAIDTRIGDCRITATGSGGVVVSGGGAVLHVSGGAVNAKVADGDDYQAHVTITSGGVSINASDPTNDIGVSVVPGAVGITGNYGGDGGVAVNIDGRPVAKQLVNSVSDELTPNIMVLSGGTSYVYTLPLYVLEVSSVVKTTEASYLHFTLDSVTAPTPVVISGVSWLNSATFEGGKEYLVGFFDGMAVVNEVTQ